MRSLPHDPRKLAAIYAGGVVGALDPGRAGAGGVDRPGPVAVGDLRGEHGRGAAARLLLRALPRPPGGEPAPPVPRHRHLRHPDHLLDHAAGAVRDGRRRLPRRSRRPTARSTIAAGYLFVRLGIGLERRRGDFAPDDGRPGTAGGDAAGLDRGRAARRRRRRGALRRSTPRSRPALDGPFPLGILAVNLSRRPGPRPRRRGGAARPGAGRSSPAAASAPSPPSRPGSSTPTASAQAGLGPRSPGSTSASRCVAGFAAVALGHWLGTVL